jgi:uncharacterized membrane protein (UPF0127 family)
MDKIKIVLGLLIFAIIIFVVLLVYGNIKNIPFVTPQETVTIHNQTFAVTVASTIQEQEKGLSGRQSLPQNQGMYFPFASSGFYAFWMKDMKFPLDIIFINNGKVVTVYKDLQPGVGSNPPIYKPYQPANAVLEINAGLANKYTISDGDTVKTNF